MVRMGRDKGRKCMQSATGTLRMEDDQRDAQCCGARSVKVRNINI